MPSKLKVWYALTMFLAKTWRVAFVATAEEKYLRSHDRDQPDISRCVIGICDWRSLAARPTTDAKFDIFILRMGCRYQAA